MYRLITTPEPGLPVAVTLRVVAARPLPLLRCDICRRRPAEFADDQRPAYLCRGCAGPQR